jgi:hypothetical protein
MKEIIARCLKTHVLKYNTIREHEESVEQFTKDAKACTRRVVVYDETSGCGDTRNAHHYCRWWACPLTKED